MRPYVFLLVLMVAVVSWRSGVADDKTTNDSARVEIRGTLGKETTLSLLPDGLLVPAVERQAVERHPVTVARQGRARTYYLDFPDEATRKAARELVGEAVVVTGDLDFREGDEGKQRESVAPLAIVAVKSIKKAEPLPKK
jgi:hypothetical protein